MSIFHVELSKAGAIIRVKLKVKKFSEFATRVKFFNFNFLLPTDLLLEDKPKIIKKIAVFFQIKNFIGKNFSIFLRVIFRLFYFSPYFLICQKFCRR